MAALPTRSPVLPVRPVLAVLALLALAWSVAVHAAPAPPQTAALRHREAAFARAGPEAVSAAARGADHDAGRATDDAARAGVAPVPAATPHDGWRPVLLPDQWQAAGPAGADGAGGEPGVGWYRITFRVDRLDAEPWLVYLPRLREGGVLYLNGTLLTRVPEPDAQTWVRWMRPHAVTVPPAQLRIGDNELLLRVNLRNRDRIVSSVYIGPEERLRWRYEARHFLTYTMAQITVALTAAVGAFVLALWWRRRDEVDYGLFGLGCVCWALHTLNYVVETMPHPWWLYWRVLRYAATGGFAISMTLFYLRHAGFKRPALQRGFFAYWLSGPLLLLLGGPALHPVVDRYYQAGLLLVGLVMVGAAVIALRRHLGRGNVALLVSAVLGFAGSVHDYLLSQGRIVDPEGPYLLYFAAAALLGTVGALLVDRFADSLAAVEAANVTLKRRVAERERELEATHARLRVHEREQAVAAERQRILQDMHDGLGSHLLASLAAVERGALDRDGVAKVLREAIDDMRLVIDTLAPGHGGLLEAIANLRWRLEPRLRAAGVDLRFDLDPALPDALDLPPETALQVLRVLQEALANALKHADARLVRVRLASLSAPARLQLEVTDDGRGVDAATAPAAPSGSGRGLTGMRRRAARIGAELAVAPAHASDGPRRGTRVTLILPLAATAPAASLA